MIKKFINLFFILVLIGISNYADLVFPQIDLKNLFYTCIALFVCYLLFGIIFNGIIVDRIKDEKLQYSFRKTIDIIFWVVFAIITLRIWVVNPQALLVSYGIIAAGLAVALQDMFKNFAGGLIIITNKLYRVNDRIEINGKVGDVIDVGILYTTIFEIKEWVGGDQPTGRITKIPNGFVLMQSINNYTQDHNFIWDEIEIVLTYESNWQKAVKNIPIIIEKNTLQFEEVAEKDIKKLKQKYYITKKELKPKVYLQLTDNWISLSFRYLTDAKQRRQVKHDLSLEILKYIEKNKDMQISSTTSIIDIASVPEINIKNYDKKK